jgi:hypothetical protein
MVTLVSLGGGGGWGGGEQGGGNILCRNSDDNQNLFLLFRKSEKMGEVAVLCLGGF